MKETILVTGGTGYIGSWVVKYLLESGYTVRLTVRKKSRTEKFQHLLNFDEASSGTLEIYEADLLQEGSYDRPAKGCDYIFHLASPFSIRVKDAQKDLVDPAVEGTKNVLRAASNSGSVKKVVLTSSIVAVFGDNIDMQTLGIEAFDESHFNTTSSLSHQPYPYSKVKAEQAAWKIFKEQNQWQLVVINPAFVMGPPLTKTPHSESISFMKDILKGKMFAGVPDLSLGFVDVRDVARAHLLAMQSPEANGRYIIAERTMSFMAFVNIIRNHYGRKYWLPFMISPKPMLYIVGPLLGLTTSFIKNNVGFPLRLDSTKSRTKLKLEYTPLDTTVVDMVEQMKRQKLVKWAIRYPLSHSPFFPYRKSSSLETAERQAPE